VLYITCNHAWNWNNNYFSRWKSSEIISKLLQRHWTCWTIFISCNSFLKWLLRSGRGAEYCNQFVCLSDCSRAYLWNRWTYPQDFLCRSHVVVARSSSGGVAVCYALSALWMTSRSAVVGRVGRPTTTNGVATPGAESDVCECFVLK